MICINFNISSSCTERMANSVYSVYCIHVDSVCYLVSANTSKSKPNQQTAE